MFLDPDGPESSLDVVRRIACPKLENDVYSLSHHGATELGIDAVHLQICGHSAYAETHVETSMGQVVEKREPIRHIHGMVVLEADRRRAQTDLPCHSERLGQEDL